MGYETKLDSIKTALKAKLITATSFGNRVYFDWVREIGTFPTALVRLQRDRFTGEGPKLTTHIATFSIQIHSTGTGVEADLDALIQYAGEFVDLLEADRTIGGTTNNLEVMAIDYSFRQGDRAIMYYAFITVDIIYIRNV